MSPEERKKKFTELIRKDYAKLRNYVHLLIEDTADRDAEDIIQDVMLHIFDRADLTVPFHNLSAYVYKSLKNRVIDLFRKRELRTVDIENINAGNLSLEPIFDQIETNPATEFEKQELYEILYRCIDSLDENDKHLVMATEFDRITFRDLSEAWEIPVGTLLSRKSRAINKIKSNMERFFGNSGGKNGK